MAKQENKGRVLIVSDQPEDSAALTEYLQRRGYGYDHSDKRGSVY